MTGVARRAVALAVLAAACGMAPTDSEACGIEWESYAIVASQPDSSFVEGRLGVLRPTYTRASLVVAYRWLTGVGLDPAEQASLRAAADIPSSEAEAVAPWVRARALVPGLPPPPAVRALRSQDYVSSWGCAPDAFRVAASTLEARIARHGPRDRFVEDWARAQDAVFLRCATPTAAGPSPAPPDAPEWLRSDRAYQAASSLFYADRLEEAQRAFETIATSPTSPWAKTAKLVAIRTKVRLHSNGAGPELLDEALVDIERNLADPSMARFHSALRSYRNLVWARRGGRAVLQRMGGPLATARMGADFGGWVEAYELAWNRPEEGAPWRERSTDPLGAWIAVMQSREPDAFEVALSEHASGGGLPWLIAAMVHAPGGGDPRVVPLLEEAARIERSSPAFVTVSTQRARLSFGRSREESFAVATRTLLALDPADGPSARNELTVLAFRAAPSLRAMMEHVSIEVGVGDARVVGKRALHPAASATLWTAIPLRALVDVLLRDDAASELDVSMRWAAYVRAGLLGERALERRLAGRLRRDTPGLARYLDAIEGAQTEDLRSLGRVHLLLKVPLLAPFLSPWDAGGHAEQEISSVYDRYGFCAGAWPAARVSEDEGAAAEGARSISVSPGFLSAADGARARRERSALGRLGASTTFLAREAARLARALPSDPRVSEVLHLAVRMTRFGCGDEDTSASSRAAFRALHSGYPRSEWARRTRYHY